MRKASHTAGGQAGSSTETPTPAPGTLPLPAARVTSAGSAARWRASCGFTASPAWHWAPVPAAWTLEVARALPPPPAGPLALIYFGSQFAPLIIFFVMFLSIVKNNKLHHFVRFNCMQARPLAAALCCPLRCLATGSAPRPCPVLFLSHGPPAWARNHKPPALAVAVAVQAIMLDIVVMLFHILRAYLPAEIKWSLLGNYFDMFGWTCCMGTVLYCVFWTVRCGAVGGPGL